MAKKIYVVVGDYGSDHHEALGAFSTKAKAKAALAAEVKWAEENESFPIGDAIITELEIDAAGLVYGPPFGWVE